MSRTFHHGERRIRARGIRQSPPDLRRLARALIALAQAQAEADAQTLGTNAIDQSTPAATPPKSASRARGGTSRKESA